MIGDKNSIVLTPAAAENPYHNKGARRVAKTAPLGGDASRAIPGMKGRHDVRHALVLALILEPIMRTRYPVFEFELAPGQAVSFRQLPGWEVEAVGGRLWLTEEAGGGDVWLTPGCRHTVIRPGRTVIEADGALRVRLHPPAGRRAPRWLPRALWQPRAPALALCP